MKFGKTDIAACVAVAALIGSGIAPPELAGKLETLYEVCLPAMAVFLGFRVNNRAKEKKAAVNGHGDDR